MSQGKKSSPKPTAIKAPPIVTHVNYVSPLGDTIATSRSGNTQTTTTTLGEASQSMVDWSQLGSAQELQALVAPPEQRQQELNALADAVYQRQAQHINADISNLRQTAQQGLSKRFGSSAASTFGNQLLSEIDGQGLQQRNDARVSADLMANDLAADDQTQRIQRLNVFQNLLNTLDERSTGLVSGNSNLLQSETNRATDLAIIRAKQLDAWNQANYQAQRQSLLSKLAPTAGKILGGVVGLAVGNPVLGASIGGQIGNTVSKAV